MTINIGYFINSSVTPISKIDFKKLKEEGISEVYIRAQNEGIVTQNSKIITAR